MDRQQALRRADSSLKQVSFLVWPAGGAMTTEVQVSGKSQGPAVYVCALKSHLWAWAGVRKTEVHKKMKLGCGSIV